MRLKLVKIQTPLGVQFQIQLAIFMRTGMLLFSMTGFNMHLKRRRQQESFMTVVAYLFRSVSQRRAPSDHSQM
jgi:hypothetical protein